MSIHEHTNNLIWTLYCESDKEYSNEEIKRKIINSDSVDEMEKWISKNAEYSYLYAINVLEGPFPKGEDVIAESVVNSYFYAKEVLKGPFPKGEDAIARSAVYSYEYAVDVLEGPFPKGEDTIARSALYSKLYQEFLNSLK